MFEVEGTSSITRTLRRGLLAAVVAGAMNQFPLSDIGRLRLGNSTVV
jgi:hypothetical protein